MSLILSLESSAKACSVALSREGTTLQYIESLGEYKHSREITLLIEQALQSADSEISSLKAVALSSGPGSYTGLRVGASCAKGICYALGIPLIAVETLKIIAEEFRGSDEFENIPYYIPTIDARRDEVYYTVLDRNFQVCKKVDNHILGENSFQEYPNALICGDAAPKSSKIIKTEKLSFKESYPKASFMSAIAFDKYCRKAFEDIAYFNPFYLKMPNITKSKKGISILK